MFGPSPTPTRLHGAPLRRRRAFALAALWLGVALAASAWSSSSDAGPSDLVVVVHPSNPASRLDRGDLRRIFQTSRKSWPAGNRIEPLNLPEGTSQREQFDRAVLGFSPDETIRFWIDRKVRGDARPPRKVVSPSAVLSYVAATPGAIGYVPSALHASGVRVVARVSGAQVTTP